MVLTEDITVPRQREKSDYIQIKFRMKEELRAKLELAALNAGASMNAEGVHRLQQSFLDEEKLFKDVNMMALVRLLVGAVGMVEARTGEPWVENEQHRKAIAAIMVAFLTDEEGVPFHKPPVRDEDGSWMNEGAGISEAPNAAIEDAVGALLKMRGVSEQTTDMIDRLIKTDGKPGEE
jgi:hypothetical protein